MEEKQEFEMGLPNGVGEAMLAHAIDKFDVKLEQTEYGPKLIGSYEELEKAKKFIADAIAERLKELEGWIPFTLFLLFLNMKKEFIKFILSIFIWY